MRSFLPLFLTAILTLSGCLGGKSSSPSETSSDVIQPPPTTTAPSTPTEDTDDTFVPKFHAHNYWNGRTEVFLFDDYGIDIGQNVDRETKYEQNAVIVGFREFTTAINGQQAGSADSTDTIYQGTERVVFKLSWGDNDQIKGLRFYYKSAAGPQFHPITVEKNKDYSVKITQGMADMPHQLELSRWRFRIEAYDPGMEGFPQKVYVAKGTVKLTMKILNGGDTFIDPPHPFFFTKGPERYAGEINATIGAEAVAVNLTVADRTVQREVGPPLSGWKVQDRHIIPWETTNMRMVLHYNYTGPLSAVSHKLGLRFTDASGPEERRPAVKEQGAGFAIYETPISEVQTDSPYATASDWTWGVYPIVADQSNAGDFQGNVHIKLTAIKEGDTSDRGMGN